MFHHSLRPLAAEQLAQLLNSPEARKHLAAYGHETGMPVVFAEPGELLDDVMALVSLHCQPVLLAVYDADLSFLGLWRVSTPNPALPLAELQPPGRSVREFFAASIIDGALAFRVRHWACSALVYEIPCWVRSEQPWGQNPGR